MVRAFVYIVKVYITAFQAKVYVFDAPKRLAYVWLYLLCFCLFTRTTCLYYTGKVQQYTRMVNATLQTRYSIHYLPVVVTCLTQRVMLNISYAVTVVYATYGVYLSIAGVLRSTDKNKSTDSITVCRYLLFTLPCYECMVIIGHVWYRVLHVTSFPRGYTII